MYDKLIAAIDEMRATLCTKLELPNGTKLSGFNYQKMAQNKAKMVFWIVRMVSPNNNTFKHITFSSSQESI